MKIFNKNKLAATVIATSLAFSGSVIAEVKGGLWAESVAESSGFNLSYNGEYQRQYSANNGEAKITFLLKTDGSINEICFTAYLSAGPAANISSTKAFQAYAMREIPKSLQNMANGKSFEVSGLSVYGGNVYFENGMYIWGHHTSTYNQNRMCVSDFDPRKGYTTNSESIPLKKL